MSNNGKEKAKNWLTDTIIIAASPFIAYLITFSYESGFTGYFGIPPTLITVSLTNVLITLIGVIFIFIPLMWICEYVFFVLTATKGQIYKWLFVYLPFILFIVFAFIKLPKSWRPILIGIIATLFGYFLVRIISPRFKKLLGGFKGHEIDDGQFSFLSRFSDLIGLTAFMLICLLPATCLISYHIGQYEASRQTDFLVCDNPSDTAILRIYSDKVICATFVREKKEMIGNFLILKFPDTTIRYFRNERVGPLRPLPVFVKQ